MAYNNIYDEICYKIDDYKRISHVRPNILYMGADRYEELFNYCQRVSLSREVVYEYDDNNEIINASENNNTTTKKSKYSTVIITDNFAWYVICSI